MCGPRWTRTHNLRIESPPRLAAPTCQNDDLRRRGSTLILEVPGWPGHLAGQHVDVRLTAPDGYQAACSHSLAAPANGGRIEITVQLAPDGAFIRFPPNRTVTSRVAQFVPHQCAVAPGLSPSGARREDLPVWVSGQF